MEVVHTPSTLTAWTGSACIPVIGKISATVVPDSAVTVSRPTCYHRPRAVAALRRGAGRRPAHRSGAPDPDGYTRLEFMTDMSHFIESMPKAELHVHVE